MIGILAGMPAFVLGITLVFPFGLSIAQCVAPPPPARQVAIGPPGVRTCCSLGYAEELDPSALTNITGKGAPLHQYGNTPSLPQSMGITDEPVG